MIFRQVYLDKILRDELCYLGIRQKWIKDYMTIDEEMPDGFHWNRIKRRLIDKSRILLYLTLFEKIDGTYSVFDLSRLKYEGIIDGNADIINYKEEVNIHFGDKGYTNLSNIEKTIVNNLRDNSNAIILLNSTKIGNQIKKEFLLRRKNNIYSDHNDWSYLDRVPSLETIENMTEYISDDNEVNIWKTR